MDIGIVINLLMVLLLVVLTAFFVGAEFAVVKVRISRIDQLIAEGNKKALAAKKLVTELDYYLSACQLGITVTALGLGALGEPTIERILHPIFHDWGVSDAWATPISYALALSLMTFLHVVFGELAPKTLAIQFAERLTLLLSGPLVLFGKILFPLIWLLNGSARLFLRIFGIQPAGHEQAHSEEELKIIMTQSYQSGEINQTELAYMQNIFAFDERMAKDIMVPRMQVVAIDERTPTDEILRIIDENRYTRYPVTQDGDKDKIIGFLNAKEFMTEVALGRQIQLKDAIHDIEAIHETSPLQNVLLKMQKNGVPISLVVDEYGGTAGIITMEDILEEIVGEIRDEFDTDEQPDILKVSDNEYILNGRVLLDDIEEQFGLKFDNDYNVDTIGGWLQVQLISLDDEPEPIRQGKHRWTIIEMDNHQILKTSLELNVTDPEEMLAERAEE
ncbi:HlyC/CorC family transporter [Paenibacillus nanensis]|uniref:HlyC/CorC family transporter n=1 Tax=Paenibacillus nanensis TaxID=393251 RepID=A0A3A1UHI4_9BACL|nr:hemolysin family protein [Paenibacillus nanensis]RIX46030.1 HlyC/CorC family transporter [Paenibacillus nanensis]